MKRTNKDQWKQFEQQVAAKRTGTKNQSHIVPEDLGVKRMSPIPSVIMKKYKPLDTRDFVPFTGFYELSLENRKIVLERYYHLPKNSCDVFVSGKGPSCTRFEEIKGKKLFLVRFLENRE